MLISPYPKRVLPKIMNRYVDMTRDELIARLAALESSPKKVPGPDEYHTQPTPKPPTPSAPTVAPVTSTPAASAAEKPKFVKKKKEPVQFQWGAQSTRHIALLVSYLGWPYSGLAIQPTSHYPTVEGELLKALEKTYLVGPGGWEACGFSRCGRTDRGVSGAGQVLNLWVRSTRKEGDGGYPLNGTWKPPSEERVPRQSKAVEGMGEGAEGENTDALAEKQEKKTAKAPPQMDLGYPRLLNSVLPDDIRVLAWSPAPTDFDSRFSCDFRHYKYAFHIVPSPGAEPLDLDLMTEAAKLLLGEHDFRNFCKVDGSKQIESHKRTVLQAYFEKESEGVYIFNLVGNAFLWHQVRHIMAVLFLVGSRLEPPSVVTDLMDVERFPGKLKYKMADPIPLRLHECGFLPEAGLDWRYGPYDGPWQTMPEGPEKEAVRHLAEHGQQTLERTLEAQRQQAEIKAWQIAGAQQRLNEILKPESTKPETHTVYPLGGGMAEWVRKYTPMVEREMGDTPDMINQRWRENKGARRAARKGADDDDE
ncbi:pseudouridylate synthase [Trichosporon asahii var. asahii CBS 8904]|uniref:Pseudouridylate synthase n=1 Tax=Trichosporon asahii var. asahii (strain CBS 8904) TaxID=1220162 RepID=K1WBK1_TRIAC|nr:pseudouridylate synthase [Trichosporon asahii var. asahii CBS 8904]